MNVSSLSTPASVTAASMSGPSASRPQALARGLEGPLAAKNEEANEELKEKFNDFVGQTLFGQLLKSMRKTVGKPAYFHGGQAEEIFQQQLDQVLGEKLAESSGSQLSDPMFELFQLGRK